MEHWLPILWSQQIPYDSSIKRRVAYGLKRGLFIATLLTAVLGIGTVFGAAEELREMGSSVGRSILGYWVGGFTGPLLYYLLRPWHRTTIGLYTAATLGIAGGFAGFLGSALPSDIVLDLRYAWVLVIMSLVPGLVLFWHQRYADKKQGLLSHDA
jgi:uncharacterized membrane protein